MNDDNSENIALIPEPSTSNIEWDMLKYITITLSIFSLIISLYTFYFQNIQIRHDLQGDLYYVYINNEIIKGEFLISNTGNQVEVVRSVDYVFSLSPDCYGDNFLISSNPVPPPVTLKPNESSVLKLNIPISDNIKNNFNELKFQSGGTFDRQAYLCGLFNVLGPNGQPDDAMYQFGAVEVNIDGTIKGPYSDPTANSGLIKLPTPKAKKSNPIMVYAPPELESKKK